MKFTFVQKLPGQKPFKDFFKNNKCIDENQMSGHKLGPKPWRCFEMAPPQRIETPKIPWFQISQQMFDSTCTGGNPKSLAAGKKGCLDTLFLNGSIVGLTANSTAIQLSLKDGIQKTIWWLEQGWVFCGLKLLRYLFFAGFNVNLQRPLMSFLDIETLCKYPK